MVLWEVWLVSWLLAAIWSSRTVIHQPVAERLLHTTIIAAGTILLFASPRALGPLLEPLFPEPVWLGWAAVALAFLGFAYSWWARLHLGRLWSGTVTLKQDHAIVRSGPYAITRHPIYTGLLAALIGTAVIRDAGAALLGLLVLLVGLVIKLRQEERLLIAHFGPAYRDYQAQVRALVPGVW
ncbi:MAG TPA: isoprenylcysteine carboxylmethyltransferase family protein [Candidatus Eisenbacteria bacterium]